MSSRKVASSVINVAPGTLAKLKFSNYEVFEAGVELTAAILEKSPSVSWDYKSYENDKSKALHALFLINADACKTNRRSTQTEICRWLIVNIPGNCIKNGRSIINYRMPQPNCSECDVARYLLLIFKQNNFINADKFSFEINPDGCIFVRSTDYKTKYSLGELIAGNYFKVIC